MFFFYRREDYYVTTGVTTMNDVVNVFGADLDGDEPEAENERNEEAQFKQDQVEIVINITTEEISAAKLMVLLGLTPREFLKALKENTGYSNRPEVIDEDYRTMLSLSEIDRVVNSTRLSVIYK